MMEVLQRDMRAKQALRFSILTTGFSLCLMPFVLYAASTAKVVNSIQMSVSSGGTSILPARGAENAAKVVEGKTENSISVLTVVNGEMVTAYAETSALPINFSHTYTSDDVSLKDTGTSVSATAGNAEAHVQQTPGTGPFSLPAVSSSGGIEAYTESGAEVNATADAANAVATSTEEEVPKIWDFLVSFITNIFAYATRWI